MYILWFTLSFTKKEGIQILYTEVWKLIKKTAFTFVEDQKGINLNLQYKNK